MTQTLQRRAKALARLGHDGAVLASMRAGLKHGVFPRGDRRRKPTAILGPADVAALAAEGALAPTGVSGCYFPAAPGACGCGARRRRPRSILRSMPR